MHRFAINSLKVQDHLLRLSKDLPLSAVNVCKTFMIGCPPVVNEAVAALTGQEVTELEVQIDPMVFLEDDFCDESMQAISTDLRAGNPSDPVGLPPNGVEENNLDQSAVGDSKGLVPNVRLCMIVPETGLKESCNNPPNYKDKIFPQQLILSDSQIEDTTVKQEKANPEVPLVALDTKQTLDANVTKEQMTKISCISDGTYPADGQHDISRAKIVSPPTDLKKACTLTKNFKKIDLKSNLSESIKCTTYTCPVCKKVLMKKGAFKAHLEIHKTEHKYACEICLRVFKKDINLSRHRNSHTELTTFPCGHCNRVYPTKSTLRSHLITHSDDRPHVCSICSKSFKRNQDLKFHLNQHNGLRPYRCPYCPKTFASSGNCFSHRKRAHMKEVEQERSLKRNEAT